MHLFVNIDRNTYGQKIPKNAPWQQLVKLSLKVSLIIIVGAAGKLCCAINSNIKHMGGRYV